MSELDEFALQRLWCLYGEMKPLGSFYVHPADESVWRHMIRGAEEDICVKEGVRELLALPIQPLRIEPRDFMPAGMAVSWSPYGTVLLFSLADLDDD